MNDLIIQAHPIAFSILLAYAALAGTVFYAVRSEPMPFHFHAAVAAAILSPVLIAISLLAVGATFLTDCLANLVAQLEDEEWED